jgi:hypothetical protein
VNQLVFKRIHAGMSAKESATQVEEMFKLDPSPDGTYDESAPNAFDSLRVGIAMETGHLPSKREIRARVEANERAGAYMSDEECRDYFENTVRRRPS